MEPNTCEEEGVFFEGVVGIEKPLTAGKLSKRLERNKLR